MLGWDSVWTGFIFKDHINKHVVFHFLHHKKINKRKKKSKIQEDIHEESLEDCPSCGEGPKWQVKSWSIRMYKIDKIDDPILIDKRPIWQKYLYLG